MLRAKANCIRNDIRRYRRRADLKLYQVAHLIGASSPTNVANWEKGRKVPTLDNLLLLAAALKVPVEFLYLDRAKQMREVVRARSALPIKKPL
jgi:transcriptional regulator with XRE-family HTH domain